MKKFKLDRNYLYILIWFVLTSVICLQLKIKAVSNAIDFNVVEGANVLLCILALVSCFLHLRSASNENTQAFTRTVMGTMMLKLFALAIAALIYIFIAKENRNIPAVFISMGLYIVYAILEVRGALKMLKKPHAAKKETGTPAE